MADLSYDNPEYEAHVAWRCSWIKEIRDEVLRLADPELSTLHLAACRGVSLMASREHVTRDGSPLLLERAAEFVCKTDELGGLIDEMGGPEHPALLTLAAIHRRAADFADALLDLMVRGF